MAVLLLNELGVIQITFAYIWKLKETGFIPAKKIIIQERFILELSYVSFSIHVYFLHVFHQTNKL